MGPTAHIHRRGAVYYWRRRMPVSGSASSEIGESGRAGTRAASVVGTDAHSFGRHASRPHLHSHVQLSLRTRCPRKARAIAARLNIAFEEAQERGMLTHEQMRMILRAETERHLCKLQTLAALERHDPDFDPAMARQNDLIVANVHELLAARGPNATITPPDEVRLREQGLDDDAIEQARLMLMQMRAQGLTGPSRRRTEELLESVGADASRPNRLQAAEASLRAIAAANRHAAHRHDARWSEDRGFGEDVLTTRLRAEPAAPTIRASTTGVAPPSPDSSSAPHLQPPKSANTSAAALRNGGTTSTPPKATAKTKTEPAIGEAVGRAVDLIQKRDAPSSVATPHEKTPRVGKGKPGHQTASKKKDAKTAKTIRQVRSVGQLFVRLMEERGVGSPSSISQADVAAYWALLKDLPVSYGKSPKDADRSLHELRARGANEPGARGLAAGTINRHLTQLAGLLSAMRALGFGVSEKLDLKILRETDPRHAVDRRRAFSLSQVRAIFSHAYYTGEDVRDDAPKKVRHLVETKRHDGIFWSFLIAYYTGARREEIAALAVEDVLSDGTVGIAESSEDRHRDVVERFGDDYGEPLLHLCRNEFGRVKTDQSVRVLPIHPELVRLGLVDYAALVRSLGYGLLFPDLDTDGSTTPLGDRLYDLAIHLLTDAIPDRRPGQAYHSIRHSVTDQLERVEAPTPERVVADILGHERRGTTQSYGSRSLQSMRKALWDLPNVTQQLERSPIKVREWVAKRRPPPHWSRRSDGPTRAR